MKTEPAAPWESANFTISYIYNKDLTPESDIEKIKAGFAAVGGANDQASINAVTNINSRGGTFTVIIIYDDNDTFDSFRAKDGRTVEVHNTWLSVDGNMKGARARDALSAMLALPDPLAN
jgi:hypothetical protein